MTTQQAYIKRLTALRYMQELGRVLRNHPEEIRKPRLDAARAKYQAADDEYRRLAGQQ